MHSFKTVAFRTKANISGTNLIKIQPQAECVVIVFRKISSTLTKYKNNAMRSSNCNDI